MGKNSKFDKLNEWIKSEYDRETKEIEDSLSNDGSFDPSKVDSGKLFQRIQSGIKEIEDTEAETESQKKKWKISGQKVGKWAAVFFAVVTSVFLASMTSEANRSYFMNKMQYLVGDEITLNRGNEKESNNTVNKERQEKIEVEIENQLNILVPHFDYELQLASDDAYSIQYGDAVAVLEYQYNNNIINLRMFNKNRTDIDGIQFQGKKITELKLKRRTIIMYVAEVKETEDKKSTIVAQWEYQDGFYQLSGKVDEEEFIKILKSIIY